VQAGLAVAAGDDAGRGDSVDLAIAVVGIAAAVAAAVAAFGLWNALSR
jgi:large-conductance mechanosensitive channel